METGGVISREVKVTKVTTLQIKSKDMGSILGIMAGLTEVTFKMI
jgi:hypothetical protein